MSSGFVNWVQSWISWLNSKLAADEVKETQDQQRLTSLEEWKVQMTTDFDTLKTKVEAMETALKSLAETNAKLQAELAQPSPDAAAMQALSAEIDATLASVAPAPAA